MSSEDLARMHDTCKGTSLGRVGDELGTDHIFTQEEGWVPLWSGLGLPTGWPGFSKSPQTEWTLSEERVEEGKAVGAFPVVEINKRTIAHNPIGLGWVLLVLS